MRTIDALAAPAQAHNDPAVEVIPATRGRRKPPSGSKATLFRRLDYGPGKARSRCGYAADYANRGTDSAQLRAKAAASALGGGGDAAPPSIHGNDERISVEGGPFVGVFSGRLSCAA